MNEPLYDFIKLIGTSMDKQLPEGYMEPFMRYYSFFDWRSYLHIVKTGFPSLATIVGDILESILFSGSIKLGFVPM